MPLFFVISGFLWNENLNKECIIIEFIKKKFRSLIIPYFKIASVCLLIRGFVINFFLLDHDSYINALYKYFVGILLSIGNTEYMPSCSPIWFLTCLFFSEVILCWIMKQRRSYYYIIICIAVTCVVLSSLKIPWSLGLSIRAIPFLYLGIILKRYSVLEKKQVLLSSGLISVLAIYICDFETNFATDSYFVIVYMLTTAPIISIFILSCSRYISNLKLGGAKILNKYVGCETLFLMGYNYLINPLAGTISFHIPIIQASVGILILCIIKTCLNKYPMIKKCFI